MECFFLFWVARQVMGICSYDSLNIYENLFETSVFALDAYLHMIMLILVQQKKGKLYTKQFHYRRANAANAFAFNE